MTVCCTLALLPAGFTNRDLRDRLAPLLGHPPETMTSGQTSYDLRRLRAHGFIERIQATRRYQLTPDGLAHALFLTHLTKRFLIPAMSHITDPEPTARQPITHRHPRLPSRDHRPRQPSAPRCLTCPGRSTYFRPRHPSATHLPQRAS